MNPFPSILELLKEIFNQKDFHRGFISISIVTIVYAWIPNSLIKYNGLIKFRNNWYPIITLLALILMIYWIIYGIHIIIDKYQHFKNINLKNNDISEMINETIISFTEPELIILGLFYNNSLNKFDNSYKKITTNFSIPYSTSLTYLTQNYVLNKIRPYSEDSPYQLHECYILELNKRLLNKQLKIIETPEGQSKLEISLNHLNNQK